MLIESLPIQYNVRISAIRDGKIVDQRESHNVLTNTGRAWLAELVGANAYPNGAPTPHTTNRIKYMGLGCGGNLQTNSVPINANFARNQTAVVTVTDLEDAVPFKAGQNNKNYYLKQVVPQTKGPTFFPTAFRTKFIVEVAEAEISYAGSTTARSNTQVNTEVPISEAGLYLSAVDSDNDRQGGLATPAIARSMGSMVCYDIFSPIIITPNVMVRIEWELRF